LAETVQSKLVQHFQQNGHLQANRGVKQAPFIVLIGANMPSILTEIGFLSHSQTERSLAEEEVREQVAEGLFNGLAAYLHSLGVPTASPRAVAASER